MATDKTRSVSGRVPAEVADALESDAAELGVQPGTLLRQILEGRYSVRRNAGKTHKQVGNADDEVVALRES